MKIYVIEEGTCYDDDRGREELRWELESDYGYFTDAESAERFVAERMKPSWDKYASKLAEWEKAVGKWEAKNLELRKLGGANAAWRPTRPGNNRLYLRAVELEPAEVTA